MEVGTQDSFRSGASVEVSILNENDNYPSFNKSSYEVEIPEGSPMDYSVIQIQVKLLSIFLLKKFNYIFISLQSIFWSYS